MRIRWSMAGLEGRWARVELVEEYCRSSSFRQLHELRQQSKVDNRWGYVFIYCKERKQIANTNASMWGNRNLNEIDRVSWPLSLLLTSLRWPGEKEKAGYQRALVAYCCGGGSWRRGHCDSRRIHEQNEQTQAREATACAIGHRQRVKFYIMALTGFGQLCCLSNHRAVSYRARSMPLVESNARWTLRTLTRIE